MPPTDKLKKLINVYDVKMKHKPGLNYIDQSTGEIWGFYFFYILIWILCIRLLILFNTRYDRISIIIAFLIGFLGLFFFDFLNASPYEISVDKADKRFYIYNSLSEPDAVLFKNSVFKFPDNKTGALVDIKLFKEYVKAGKIKYKKLRDINSEEWGKQKYFKLPEERTGMAGEHSTQIMGKNINLVMNAAYYLFTMIITLAIITVRINKKLFYRILPWILISAIVGLGTVFVYLWEQRYSQLLFHLLIKKKLLMMSISFSLAACFIVYNNI